MALDNSGTLTSYDGLSWTPQTVEFSDLIYAKEHFVATCFIPDYVSPVSGIQASVDGTNWHWVLRDLYPNIFPDALAFGNDRFVAISSGGVVLVSTNLTQWVTNIVGGNSWGYVKGLSFVNGFFLARWSGGAFTSADGFTWTTLPDGPYGSPSGSGIITCNRSFLSPGGGGIMISSNGLDWLSMQGKYSGGITAIATDQRTVVAVSDGGLLQIRSFGCHGSSFICGQPARPNRKRWRIHRAFRFHVRFYAARVRVAKEWLSTPGRDECRPAAIAFGDERLRTL